MQAAFKSFFAVILSLVNLAASFLGLWYIQETKPIFPDEPTPVEKEEFNEGEFSLSQNDIIVAQDGSGDYASIAQAKQALRNTAGSETVTVWIKGGTYFLSEPLVFDENDRSNVIYRSMPGEAVELSGAKVITGFAADTLNGENCWSVQLDKSQSNWYFKSLYNGNTILQRPRYPETGYLLAKGTDPADALFTEKTTFWELTRGERSVLANKGDLKNFSNLQDITVRILHYWKDEIMYASSYDAAQNKLMLSRPSSMLIRENDRYFLENVLEAFNEPGEWYLDKTNAKLYYKPLDGQIMNDTTLYAGVNDTLLKLDGVNNITFQGLSFRDTDWNIPSPKAGYVWENSNIDHPQAAYDVDCAVEINNAENISVVDCKFYNIGNSALRFGQNVQNSTAEANLFRNIGGNAVYIHGENIPVDDARVTKNIKIADNHINGYGRRFFNAIGVLLVHANSCEISNNEIHDGYYTAISSGWVWGYGYTVTNNIKILDNLIYDIGQGWLSDMGGIYTLGMQPDSVTSGNVIHDVAADPNEGGYGGWGIYPDEGSSGFTIENNLVYNCLSNAFHQHYGKENTVRNNIFALSGEAEVRVSRKEEHTSIILTGNIILSNNNPIYSKLEKGQIIDDKNLYYDLKNKDIVFAFSEKLIERKGRVQLSAMGLLNNGVFENPLFKNPLKGDFTLAENSPAITEIGFTPWDYSKAGTITLFAEIE